MEAPTINLASTGAVGGGIYNLSPNIGFFLILIIKWKVIILNTTAVINKINNYGSQLEFIVKNPKILLLLSIPPYPKPKLNIPPTINDINISKISVLLFFTINIGKIKPKIDINNIATELSS